MLRLELAALDNRTRMLLGLEHPSPGCVALPQTPWFLLPVFIHEKLPPFVLFDNGRAADVVLCYV